MESMRRLELNRVILEAGIQECNLTVKEEKCFCTVWNYFRQLSRNKEYSGLELCHKADQIEGDICIDRVEGMQMDRKGHVLSVLGNDFMQMALLKQTFCFMNLIRTTLRDFSCV